MAIKVLTWAARILFGVVFIFAGFTKAIDPLGSAYKFEDYFLAFNMEGFFSLALPMAILLNTVEMLVGFAILLGLKMKLSAWAGLLFMAFFTPLTLYIAITDPVPDCGCFGDAIIISNWDTFYKNVVFLAAAIWIFIQRKNVPPLWSEKKDWYIVGGITALILWLSVYCLLNLPIIDFRSWKIGNDMTEQIQPIQEEIIEYTFIYENTKTNERKEFDVNNLPTDENWTYVDRKENVIQEYIASPIENFSILDEYEFDYTEDFIGNPDYQFLAVAYELDYTKKNAFKNKLNEIAAGAEKDGYSFIILTGSSYERIRQFQEEMNAFYDFYQSDERELKTIIRSNPGLVLLKDGVVINKWHFRNIPDYDSIREKYLNK